MDKNEIYAKVNAKQQEIVDVWDQINFQKQLVENYEGMLKDPRLIEMDAKMDQAIKKVEDPAIFGLPEAAVNVLQERQKLSSQITGLYSDIAETQAKIIQKLGQVLNLQADIIDIFTAPDNEQ
ncbi:hypothetical protein ACTEYT_10325 (plasmid) [Limosilactobacillus reuteri]|uniref:Uncharacterized protein n=1 Tax=Limosilactobacillus reuteri subsp. suis (strain ATCC 53608 / LMG 31752 / 1063) TaxID=927703 RepID=F8KGH5_LIMR5|nr:hypothetical protein LRATCC53608_1822 [Limosilactobacillus reuteri subsp. suis]CUU13496.1 hypothetical protein predicted by prodigal [Limosilactobacillus reuteri subsp. suis]